MKAFTLTELLAVIVIIALIGILIIPSVINIISNSTDEITEAQYETILAQTKIFVLENIDTYEKVNGNQYCIKVSDLAGQNYLTQDYINNLKTPEKINIEVNVRNDEYHYNFTEECN